MKRIYLSPPHMSGREVELVQEAFASNWIAPLGPHVDAFEQEVAAYVGVPAAAALSSGTAALHLALIMLGVSQDDEVLCSTLTFSASANAIVYAGARPVFIDADRTSWNLDPNLVEEEIAACATRGRLPKAVMAVDLYGQCADYDALHAICDPYGIPIIEDSAEALGASYKGKKAGRLGAMGVFSFNGNKIITTSGGGMLVSENPDFVKQARFLATQARDPAPHYQHSHIGYNYRMSNVLAAIGRGQLTVLDQRVARKREHAASYQNELADLPGIGFMPEAQYGTSNRWLTCVTIDPSAFGATCEDIRLALEAENIESRPVWKPMHLQPVYAGCRKRGGAVAETVFRNGLCLPSGSSLTDAERSLVVQRVRATAAGFREAM
jgi:dTDP-4-amino-4,6-dideoxygalactose transaminase